MRQLRSQAMAVHCGIGIRKCSLVMLFAMQALVVPATPVATAIWVLIMYIDASGFACWLIRAGPVVAAAKPGGDVPVAQSEQPRSPKMSFRTRIHAALAVCLLTLALPSVVAAQSESTGKIGYVDIQKILATSKAGRRLTADLERQRNVLEVKLKSMQPPMTDLRTRIVEGGSTLSEEQLTQLKRELEDKTAEMSRAQDDATRDIKKMGESGLAAIEQKVMPAINQIGKEGGYSFIFRKYESGLIYADEAGDITEQVIQRMDAEGQ